MEGMRGTILGRRGIGWPAPALCPSFVLVMPVLAMVGAVAGDPVGPMGEWAPASPLSWGLCQCPSSVPGGADRMGQFLEQRVG